MTKRGWLFFWGVGLSWAVSLEPSLAGDSLAGPWRISGYYGRANPAPLLDILSFQDWQLRKEAIAMLALSKEIATLPGWTRYEVEGQLGWHFQTPLRIESNLAILARWIAFPWKKWVPTTVALGGGGSYTWRATQFELDTQPNTSNLLHYLLFEISIGPGFEPRLEIFGRIHHRSGIFGLLNGVWGGSDYACLGVRWQLGN